MKESEGQTNARVVQSRGWAADLVRRAIGASILAAGAGIGISEAFALAITYSGADQAACDASTRVEMSLATALTSIGNSR
jgi:hypothetical protein